ncbi:MAG TPA: DUF3182 family protein [Burkholderiaceae bacterium]
MDKSHGIVVFYPCKPCNRQGHEYLTHSEIARRLAHLKAYEYAGEFDSSRRYDRPLYFVPNDTFVSTESIRNLGVTDEHDLFGGVVPFPFVATKIITHDLPHGYRYAPAGWSAAFSRLVREKVLPGFSAYTFDDAHRAARDLLEHGKVRFKKANSMGGLGQSVIAGMDELHACLDEMSAEELQRDGVILEMNLNDVATYSVGRIRVGNLLATYWGTQQLTTSNDGEQVYGGSTLDVVRGDFDVLLRLDLDSHMHTAIEQARTYHAAAFTAFPGMLVSRANYDVAQGMDDEGQWHSGVLEQSWRIGGASAAEVAALEAFQANPDVSAVRASTTEIYGETAAVPQDALLHYQGVDEQAGPLAKFSRLECYANTR